jgi:hypothetical protein
VRNFLMHISHSLTWKHNDDAVLGFQAKELALRMHRLGTVLHLTRTVILFFQARGGKIRNCSIDHLRRLERIASSVWVAKTLSAIRCYAATNISARYYH